MTNLRWKVCASRALREDSCNRSPRTRISDGIGRTGNSSWTFLSFPDQPRSHSLLEWYSPTSHAQVLRKYHQVSRRQGCCYGCLCHRKERLQSGGSNHQRHSCAQTKSYPQSRRSQQLSWLGLQCLCLATQSHSFLFSVANWCSLHIIACSWCREGFRYWVFPHLCHHMSAVRHQVQ